MINNRNKTNIYKKFWKIKALIIATLKQIVIKLRQNKVKNLNNKKTKLIRGFNKYNNDNKNSKKKVRY